MVSRAGEQHYDRALARLHYYKAISSEAYLLATPDPLESTFQAGKKVRDFQLAQIPSLRKGYKDIKENLDLFASKLLMKVDSIEEIQGLLSKSYLKKKSKRLLKSKGSTETHEENKSTLPKRITNALKMEFKQVREKELPKFFLFYNQHFVQFSTC